MRPFSFLLLGKSLHPNLLVLTSKQAVEYPPFILHSLSNPQILTLVHNLLTCLDSNLTIPRNRLRSSQRPFDTLLGRRKHPRSQTPLIRFPPTETLACQDQFHRPRFPNCPRQPLTPSRTRYHAQLDLGLSKIRLFRTVQNVRHHCQLTASSQRMPIHGRNDGFLDRGRKFGPGLDKVVSVGVREGFGGHFFNVGACCKGFVGAGKDYGADGRVVVEGLEG